MEIRIPELLVPAGGMEQLKAAVACGADAVYVGGVSFSARARASNFDEEELREAIVYAHTCGVRIHVAMNTLLTDGELPEALEFAAKLYRYGADAVIVQDTGLFSLIRQYIPGLSLHLSTQGTATDLSGVRVAAERGAERVILARELSLEEIRTVCRHKGSTEIEIFVHGAICIGLSGQCHMSGMIGGRSGNRGDCAQPCRMKYLLEREDHAVVSEGYQLSPKDMCLLGSLREISEAGVDSIKIEGRMKSPEYVAAVTSIYRKHLDWIREGALEQAAGSLRQDLRLLRQMYSRGEFTDAYLHGHAGAELMSGMSPKHQGLPVGRMIRFNPKNGHALIRLSEDLSVGDGVEIRGENGSADNIVTYIKDQNRSAAGQAGKGTQAEIGDLRIRDGVPEKGSVVYKLTDKALSQQIRQMYGKLPQRIPVRFHLKAVTGEHMTLEGRTEENGQSFTARASGHEILEQARNGPPDPDKISGKLSRTGGTPYYCTDISSEIQGEPFLQISVLNELRRKVLDGLTEQRLAAGLPDERESAEVQHRCRQALKAGKPSAADRISRKTKQLPDYQIYFYETPDLEQRIHGFTERFRKESLPENRVNVCLPFSFFRKTENAEKTVRELKKSGCSFDVALPVTLRRLPGQEETGQILKNISEFPGFRAVMLADAGQLQQTKEAGLPFEMDMALNILNTESASFWLSQGAQSVCLTEEPEACSVFHFRSVPQFCCVHVYGRVPVMHLEHCPVGAHGSDLWHHLSPAEQVPCCSPEKKYYYCREGRWILRDRKGALFPVETDSRCCRAVVYSHRKTDRTGAVGDLIHRGVGILRFSVYDESPEEILRQLKKCRQEEQKL